MKILTINGSADDTFKILIPFFNELQGSYDHSLEFQVRNKKLLKFLQENNWKCKKIFFPPFATKNILLTLLSIIFLPLVLIINILKFLIYKNYKKSRVIILSTCAEKIVFTIPGLLFKKKIIWITMLGEKNKDNKISKKLLKLNSRFAKIIVFTDSEKIRLLKENYQEKLISVLYFGINTNNHIHQENIFSEIAETKKINNVKSKFFTVGTITDLNETSKIEIIFSSIKKCVSIIPNIQFIIIGDGKMRKNLTWIAKKMEINNLVWFVGKQQHQRKWLDGFDSMVMTSKQLDLKEIKTISKAMSAGIPVIAPYNVGLEYLIDDNKNGILIDTNNSDNIAAQIIRIQQNKHLRNQLNISAKETIDNYFKLDKMVKNFNKILYEKNNNNN
jgi:glycosyltransferase involved in cell wall biosynthesis